MSKSVKPITAKLWGQLTHSEHIQIVTLTVALIQKRSTEKSAAVSVETIRADCDTSQRKNRGKK